MWPRSITFALVLFTFSAFTEAYAQHPICGRPPDWDVKSQSTEKLKGDLQGKAELLTKHLGSADLSGQIQSERETIYKNSDEPEARRQDAYLAYMFCVLIMDDKTLSTNDKIKAINEFKQPVRRTIEPQKSSKLMRPCIPGQTVHPTADTFHLQFLVIDDGPVAHSIIAPTRVNDVNPGRELTQAIRNGQIQRFTGYAFLVVHILGVSQTQLPEEVPFLRGGAICQDMVPITQAANGLPTISISVQGSQSLGQASIVLPRTALATSRRPQVCVEVNFPLAYPRQITEPQFRGRQDMTCGWEGMVPGNTALFDSLQKGINAHTYYFVRRI